MDAQRTDSDVRLRSPKEMGGEGDGTNPEQLFAVGYAACFESALGVVGRREHVELGEVSIDSRVSLLPTDDSGFKLAVEPDVTMPQVQGPERRQPRSSPPRIRCVRIPTQPAATSTLP